MERLDCNSTRDHVMECLTHWVNEPDVDTNSRDVDIISNMSGWLAVYGTDTSETLGKEVQAKLSRLSCAMGSQSCPVCSAELRWTAYNILQCSNQHKWNGCQVTCTVLGGYNGRQCTQCGAYTAKGRRV